MVGDMKMLGDYLCVDVCVVLKLVGLMTIVLVELIRIGWVASYNEQWRVSFDVVFGVKGCVCDLWHLQYLFVSPLIMDNFDMLDDDYRDMFITQTPRQQSVVSLEEETGYKTVKSPNFSDISDFEDDSVERKIRYVGAFSCGSVLLWFK